MKRQATSIILSAAFWLGSIANAQTDTSFDQAVKLFNAKDYSHALPMFSAIVRKNPSNAPACLYAAHSCYYMKDYSGARKLYEYITKNFASSTEASHATIMLNMLPAGDKVAAAATAAPAAEAKSDAPLDMDLSKLVHVVKPLGDHPAASSTLQSNVQSWLKGLPKPVAELLAKNKVNIIVTPTLMDFRPELAHTEGAGYDGATLKQCPGMYEPGNKNLILCERVISDSDNSISSPRPSDTINDTFFHEMGHAIDFCLDNVSGTSEFQRVYRFDEANLRRGDAQTERSMAYFLQKAERGQAEACGELIGVILGIKRNASETTAAFPNTIEYLKKKLKLS